MKLEFPRILLARYPIVKTFESMYGPFVFSSRTKETFLKKIFN